MRINNENYNINKKYYLYVLCQIVKNIGGPL